MRLLFRNGRVFNIFATSVLLLAEILLGCSEINRLHNFLLRKVSVLTNELTNKLTTFFSNDVSGHAIA